MRFRRKLGKVGPGRKGVEGGALFSGESFLSAKVTLMIKRAILLRSRTVTMSCASTPALGKPRIFGFARMHRSSLAEELVLSAAERRSLSL